MDELLKSLEEQDRATFRLANRLKLAGPCTEHQRIFLHVLTVTAAYFGGVFAPSKLGLLTESARVTVLLAVMGSISCTLGMLGSSLLDHFGGLRLLCPAKNDPIRIFLPAVLKISKAAQWKSFVEDSGRELKVADYLVMDALSQSTPSS
jgi:hypothetical protein